MRRSPYLGGPKHERDILGFFRGDMSEHRVEDRDTCVYSRCGGTGQGHIRVQQVRGLATCFSVLLRGACYADSDESVFSQGLVIERGKMGRKGAGPRTGIIKEFVTPDKPSTSCSRPHNTPWLHQERK